MLFTHNKFYPFFQCNPAKKITLHQREAKSNDPAGMPPKLLLQSLPIMGYGLLNFTLLKQGANDDSMKQFFLCQIALPLFLLSDGIGLNFRARHWDLSSI